MSGSVPIDEDLVRRLPLPLARLYRQAHNAKTPLDRHQSAYFLWEAGLKLIGSTAVVIYAQSSPSDARIDERLKALARPAVGHWWEFVRLLLPELSQRGDAGSKTACDFVLGPARDDLPRAAGLNATLCEVRGGASGARSRVRVSELSDNLVSYRNQTIGHGALGQQTSTFYDRVGRALLAGVSDLLGQFDVLAGRSLVYVSGVQPQPSGEWLVEWYELIGESARRLEPLRLAADEVVRLPRPERLYLQQGPGKDRWTAVELHPLVVYDAEAAETYFLNSRRGSNRTEYLCFSSGRIIERDDVGTEQRELLRRLLQAPIDEPSTAIPTDPQAGDAPAPAEVGATLRRIGEFEIISELGRGAMGRVFRAWQPSLGRQVAVKCLIKSGDKAEARFAQEIRALGQVRHESLVQVFTSGAIDDQWFYTMELVDGATLSDVCESLHSRSSSPSQIDLNTWREAVSTVCEQSRSNEKAKDSPTPELLEGQVAPSEPQVVPAVEKASYARQVAELVRQAALAAHALHQHPSRIIHRDIKPANIMVTADGQRAVLMDLGLAQLADAVDRKLTRTRQFVGTLRYASPEQLMASDRLDARSDVYSLGATLWELLTLRPLFDATEETPTPEVMRRIQFDEPAPIKKYHPNISGDLEAITLKCLEKNPAQRYASARELADDLGRWLKDEPVRARKHSAAYRAMKFVRRHRQQLTFVAVLLAAGVLLGRWISQSDKQVVPPPVLTTNSDPKSTDTKKADGEPASDQIAVTGAADLAPGRSLPPSDALRSAARNESARAGGAAPPQTGKQWALLIGVGQYERTAPLQFISNDVTRLVDVLEHYGDYSPSKIRQVFDDSETSVPVKQQIEDATTDWLSRPEPGDTLIVYFSGYSIRDDEGRLFLAPRDFDPTQPTASSIPVEWIQKQLVGCRASLKLLILDTASAAAESNTGEHILDPNTVPLASCGAHEAGSLWPAKQQSLFAYWLKEGLKGHSDLDGDGKITIFELGRYVRDHVVLTSKRLDRSQTPVLTIRGMADDPPPVLRLQPQPLNQVLSDTAEQLAVALEDHHIAAVAVQFSAPDAWRGNGAELLGQNCAAELQRRLRILSGENFTVVDRNGKDIREERVPSLVVSTRRKGRLVAIETQLDNQGEVDPSIRVRGLAQLTDSEWGMTGGSRIMGANQPDAAAAQHPLQDPQFAFPTRIFVDGRERRPFFQSADSAEGRIECLVGLKPGEKYEVRVENHSANAVMMRLLVDGLNTLPEKEFIKGTQTFVPQKRVSLEDARAWILDPASARGSRSEWNIRGYVLQGRGDNSLRSFTAAEGKRSSGADPEAISTLGLVTAAFYAEAKAPRGVGTGAGSEVGTDLARPPERDSKPGDLLAIVNIRLVDAESLSSPGH